jgi:hypothetical protein
MIDSGAQAPAMAAGACIHGSAALIATVQARRIRPDIREIVQQGPLAGMLAFDGNLPVGWCQLTPRDAVPGGCESVPRFRAG